MWFLNCSYGAGSSFRSCRQEFVGEVANTPIKFRFIVPSRDPPKSLINKHARLFEAVTMNYLRLFFGQEFVDNTHIRISPPEPRVYNWSPHVLEYTLHTPRLILKNPTFLHGFLGYVRDICCVLDTQKPIPRWRMSPKRLIRFYKEWVPETHIRSYPDRHLQVLELGESNLKGCRTNLKKGAEWRARGNYVGYKYLWFESCKLSGFMET